MSEQRYRVRWIGGDGGWYVQDHKNGVHTKSRCDLREDADETAAALNAAEENKQLSTAGETDSKLTVAIDDLLRDRISLCVISATLQKQVQIGDSMFTEPVLRKALGLIDAVLDAPK